MPMNFPDTPTNGQTFTSGGVVWAWNGVVWNPTSTPGAVGASTVTVGDVAPPNPAPGNLWWNSSAGDGQLYIDYNDGTSSQWVVTNNLGAGLYLPILGTTTNDNASAGCIGEYVSVIVVAPGVTLSNNVAANAVQLTLQPGDWDVVGEPWVSATGTGTVVNISVGLTTASATMPGGPGDNSARLSTLENAAAPAALILAVGPARFSLAVATTVYLTAQVGFSATACTVYGKLRARRVR
jgi:hypothetical protein